MLSQVSWALARISCLLSRLLVHLLDSCREVQWLVLKYWACLCLCMLAGGRGFDQRCHWSIVPTLGTSMILHSVNSDYGRDIDRSPSPSIPVYGLQETRVCMCFNGGRSHWYEFCTSTGYLWISLVRAVSVQVVFLSNSCEVVIGERCTMHSHW